MRKIIVGAQVSIDGVMQAPGGPTEDPTKGFKLGGWAMPYFSQEFGEELDHLFKEKFDLLLGRKTYEIFAALKVTNTVVRDGMEVAVLYFSVGQPRRGHTCIGRRTGRLRIC